MAQLEISRADPASRYTRTIEASKRIRWDIDKDVIRGRSFALGDGFMPEGLSLLDELPWLDAAQARFVGQIQGRTYANMFGLVERFIGAQMLQISRAHWLGDQTALEAIVRLTDEELKHQALFRRIEGMVAERMPAGYRFVPEPNDVARFVLGKCAWAVLALTCHIELFSLAHYRASIAASPGLSPLFKDIFLFHWKEESQHVVIDELEWEREDAQLASDAERDAAADELIALVGGVDAILQAQARADAGYAGGVIGLADGQPPSVELHGLLLKAYRWQYIVSGTLEPRFQSLLARLAGPARLARIQAALAPLAHAVPVAGVAAYLQ